MFTSIGFLERLIGEGKNILVIEERQTTNGEKVRRSRLRTFLLFLVNNHTDMKFPKSIEVKEKQKQKRDFHERDQRNNDMLRFKFSQRSSSEISWAKRLNAVTDQIKGKTKTEQVRDNTLKTCCFI